jgi:hypothetical protein
LRLDKRSRAILAVRAEANALKTRAVAGINGANFGVKRDALSAGRGGFCRFAVSMTAGVRRRRSNRRSDGQNRLHHCSLGARVVTAAREGESGRCQNGEHGKQCHIRPSPNPPTRKMLHYRDYYLPYSPILTSLASQSSGYQS